MPPGDLQKVFCSFASFGGRQVGHDSLSVSCCYLQEYNAFYARNHEEKLSGQSCSWAVQLLEFLTDIYDLQDCYAQVTLYC